MPFLQNDGQAGWSVAGCFGHPVFGVTLGCLLLIGCSDSENESRGIRVAVEGVVTLDDENLPAGRIISICDQGAGK